jgi:UDP-N-acetylmuramate--alanine ligase
MRNLNSKKSIYLIGIGGIGVSGLANLLLKAGHLVQGSDLVENNAIKNLRKDGAIINIGHSESNIKGDIDVVVVSSAAKQENPEIKKAQELGIPIIHRSEMLSLLTSNHKVIAVGGSHGKTTTTSLVSSIVEAGKLDPTIFIGGIWENINSNAKAGNGEYAIIEADESDGSLLNYRPHIAIVTNIEYEHVDYYKSLCELKQTFLEFTNRVSEDGLIVLCEDDENCRELRTLISKRAITYGFTETSDILARNITYDKGRTHFDVYIKNGDTKHKYIGNFSIEKMGEHNVKNALAAVCVGIELGLAIEDIHSGLSNCKGVDRRMQLMAEGDLLINNKLFKDLTVIQDYGHHPTEILFTIQSLRNAYKKRIVTIFQPHRYSRTKAFLNEFCSVLAKADYLLITDIYPGSEEKIEGFSIDNLLERFENEYYDKFSYFNGVVEMKHNLEEHLIDGDIVLFIGAGDIYNMCNALTREFN